ncbi:hypothetical protein [Guptibacillus hwajinpoensis]|uniref:Uncharacterized protein n=1 Tax=Guptibacillus hwajinpoensis TaxID=208199 RepID=A0ABU0K7R7_9BACL|nr:hypothetical protein [Alkalihalobacillus hemicentroti]MDQ0484690.1 hypothetical protein [Alkalihalobacillus hemicentroti]
MNTFFVFRSEGEAIEGLGSAARHEKRRRAFRNGDIGALEWEHVLCVPMKE